jgi:hypothetical protein
MKHIISSFVAFMHRETNQQTNSGAKIPLPVLLFFCAYLSDCWPFFMILYSYYMYEQQR